MRAICKLALDGMNKTDINSPIILQKITIILFSRYLATRRNRGGGFLSQASYYGVRIVFVHIYCMSGETMPEDFNFEISQFMSGMNRTIASKTDESG